MYKVIWFLLPIVEASFVHLIFLSIMAFQKTFTGDFSLLWLLEQYIFMAVTILKSNAEQGVWGFNLPLKKTSKRIIVDDFY